MKIVGSISFQEMLLLLLRGANYIIRIFAEINIDIEKLDMEPTKNSQYVPLRGPT